MKAGLTGVQLHGDETQDVARKVASLVELRIVKGVHAGPSLGNDLASWSHESTVSALLLDSGNGQQGGGTGKTFDWTLFEELMKVKTPFFISGGLTPDNIGELLVRIKPYAVDVSSGVELKPGKKSFRLMKEFIRQANK